MTDKLLQDPDAFAEAMDRLPAGPVAIDTEFVRERTYFAHLCLIQIAAGSEILLADPLALPDVARLAALLVAPDRPKIVHAARQDVEVLLPSTGVPMAPLLDTQVAAGLLGHPAQVGYAELVRRLLGVELAKGHARTDWTARPLSPAQLVYAADDVRYLGAVMDALGAQLEQTGRLAWFEQDCALLSDPELYRQEPEDAWQRLKGLERLSPAGRAAARALASWRENRAVQRDLPRGWILPDEAIRALAETRPVSAAALAGVEALPPRTAARFGSELLAVLNDARPEAVDFEAGGPQERPTPEQQAQMKRLQATLKTAAEELNIVPEVLATRRDMAAMIRGARDVPALGGWRREAIGERLLAAL